MKRETLSFLIASTLLFAGFGIFKAVIQKDGRAHASASHTVDGSEDISASHKRNIRRKISRNAGALIDLSAREVQAVLGAPGLVRRDLPTVVWQYRNEACVLDMYFTTSEDSLQKSPVVHYEIRARQVGVKDKDVQGDCAVDLVRETSGVNLVNINALYKSN